MSNLFELFATDKNAEENGVWVKVGDAELRIARDNNKRYRDFMQKLFKRHRQAFKTNQVSIEKLEELTTAGMAEAILVDWRSVKDRDGNDLPYSKENALRLLTDLPELKKHVNEVSSEYSAYRPEEDEDAEKN